MKVLMVGNHESVHGGITSVIQQLLSHDWEKDGVKMYFLPSYRGGNVIDKVSYFLGSFIKIKSFIINEKPDVVHIHMSHHGSFDRASLIGAFCKKKGVPVVVHLHGSEFKKYFDECNSQKKKKIQKFFKECSTVITLGNDWKNFVLSIVPIANVVVLNNTVHIPDETVKQEENKIHFLYLGVLFKRKGLDDLLQAIKKVVSSGCIDGKDVVFNIGGTGPEESQLKAKTQSYRITQYVNYLGWVNGNDKINELTSNQVFVLPSYNEGLPIAILEAISYGMPVIATSVGSVSEAVKNSINGYAFKPGDIDGYAKAITDLICNYELRCSMAQASRNLATEKFNENVYFDKIVEIYKKSKKV